MDLSKLPKMSKTSKPKPALSEEESASQPTPRRAQSVDAPSDEDRPMQPLGIGAEIWFMTIVGIVLILFGRNYIRYEMAQLAHQPYHTGIHWESGDKAGQEVEYVELNDFSNLAGGAHYTDSCFVLFGLTLIIDAVGRGLAVTRLPGRPAILGFTLLVTLFAVGYNLYVAAKYFSAGSLPIVSLLAVAFGGYLAMAQLAMLKTLLSRGTGGA